MRTAMPVLGAVAMPTNFRYAAVLERGMPQHSTWDPFRIKHPSMPASRWAKIFSPFDALKGFNEAVAAKEVLYEFKRELDEDTKSELNRRLGILQMLTINGRRARENKVTATIAYYVPCGDKDHSAYGYRGQYKTVSGIVWNVDTAVSHTVLLNDQRIRFSDIVDIESDHTVYDAQMDDERGIFETSWEVDAP